MPWAIKHRSKKQKELRLRYFKQGLCYQCGNKSEKYSRCSKCLSKQSYWHNRRYAEIKELVFNNYGGPKCNCCGEETKQFLSIDHINNDGAKHRKEYKNTGGKKIYFWLFKNNYPEGFQILCMNCNFGKRINGGACPHVQTN